MEASVREVVEELHNIQSHQNYLTQATLIQHYVATELLIISVEFREIRFNLITVDKSSWFTLYITPTQNLILSLTKSFNLKYLTSCERVDRHTINYIVLRFTVNTLCSSPRHKPLKFLAAGEQFFFF